MSILNILKSAKSVYLDTAPIIYQIEENDNFLQSTNLIFDMIEQKELLAVTSLVNKHELYIKPFREKDVEKKILYDEMFVSCSDKYVSELSEEIFVEASKLRAINKSLKDFDSLHLAIAIQENCDVFLTNDIKLKKLIELGNLKVIVLTDLEQELKTCYNQKTEENG